MTDGWEILRREEQFVGRPCEMIDTARLAGGITVVVYSMDSGSLLDGKIMRTTRVAVSVDDISAWSGIASTEWLDGPLGEEV